MLNWLNEQQFYLYGQIQTSQKGGMPYFPYDDCSLSYPLVIGVKKGYQFYYKSDGGVSWLASWNYKPTYIDLILAYHQAIYYYTFSHTSF